VHRCKDSTQTPWDTGSVSATALRQPPSQPVLGTRAADVTSAIIGNGDDNWESWGHRTKVVRPEVDLSGTCYSSVNVFCSSRRISVKRTVFRFAPKWPVGFLTLCCSRGSALLHEEDIREYYLKTSFSCIPFRSDWSFLEPSQRLWGVYMIWPRGVKAPPSSSFPLLHRAAVTLAVSCERGRRRWSWWTSRVFHIEDTQHSSSEWRQLKLQLKICCSASFNDSTVRNWFKGGSTRLLVNPLNKPNDRVLRLKNDESFGGFSSTSQAQDGNLLYTVPGFLWNFLPAGRCAVACTVGLFPNS
jgi:hypothetical protein